MNAIFWSMLTCIVYFDKHLAAVSSSGSGNGKLATITIENILLFEDEFLYTKKAVFRLEHVDYKILLRQYFVLHPNMNIYVDGYYMDQSLNGMPTFFYGSNYIVNRTSIVGRLSDKYFNGTLYHGEQVTFFNCRQEHNHVLPTQISKYVCVIYHDEEVEKIIDALRSKKTQCGSQDKQHINAQTKATEYNRNFIHPKSDKRKKRSTNSVTCVLHLLADQKFYKHVGGESIANTVSEMVSSVMEADVIFRGTDFDGDGPGDNIGFVVGNITIYTSENNLNNKFSAQNINVYDYLDILTEYDFSSYCLGIGYTHRDFERGVVGLAWVASSSFYGTTGGICQSRVISSSNTHRSYNTAIVTYLNYDTFIPSQKSALTLTHELGHSFGSSHDDAEDPNCSPNGIYGSFIMDPYTNSGEKPNHRKFSQCSINSMYPVIVNKGGCFKRYTGPICGNSVVEGSEECDCGTAGICSYTDPCCTPADPGFSSDPACTIRRSEGKSCSPVSSPCCDETCQIIAKSSNTICRRPTECSMATYCNGNSSSCQTPEIMPDGKLCNSGRKTCVNGECSASICQSKGLEVCQCLLAEDNLCKLCCKFGNDTNCDCLPASTFDITHVNGATLYLLRGDSCNNFKGFCDNNKCLFDDKSNIYSRMKEIFSEQNIKDIAYWFQNFWYYIIIALVLLVLTSGIYKATSMRIKNIDIDVEALRYGKLMSICRGANNQIQCFQEKMDFFTEKFDSKIQDIQRNRDFRSPLLAISRLQMLFPEAEISVISDVVHTSSTEEFSVKMLLIKGYSMKKYNLQKKHDLGISKSVSRIGFSRPSIK